MQERKNKQWKSRLRKWQSIADFIISAHINHCITDKQEEKLNVLLGKKISKYIKDKGE